MKFAQKYKLIPVLLGAALLLSACQSAGNSSGQGQESNTQSGAAGAAVLDTAGLFSERDLDGSYAADEAVSIVLEGDAASWEGDGVTAEDGQIMISTEGVYLITGTLTDGQIIVNAPDTDKVQLVLAGAEIHSATSAAIYALSADKVFLTLAEGTENTLSNGGEYIAIDENNIDGVIFSKTDLTLNGGGSLTVNAAAGHGVVSKDELVVTGGSYAITAAGHGMAGKDVLAIAGGSFAITAGKDGLHAENADDPLLGSLYLADGSYTIDAQGDGISAGGAMQIDGGVFSLTTGGGSAGVTMASGDSFGLPGQGQAADASGAAESDETVSQKGLKADGTLTINGGQFEIDSADDCLHAGGDITIAAGDFTLRSGDDALHADGAVLIQNGTFSIPYCYEGIEGLSVTIDDGVFDITSYDDGVNAAGGVDGSGFGPGQDGFASDSDSFITISGGSFTIVSQGDCLDSNGDLTIAGGTLDLTCNGAGDTALDADGAYTNSGGTVTTNDGSEHQVGGQPGQPGGQLPGSAPGGANPGGANPGGVAPGGEPPQGFRPADPGSEPGQSGQAAN